MTKKTETQFALLAAAFAADEQMARQVCSLLANGHIDESEAKMMLGLVRDGQLVTVTSLRYYQQPYWWTNTSFGAPSVPCSSGVTTIGGPSFTTTTSSLTAMCSAALEAA